MCRRNFLPSDYFTPEFQKGTAIVLPDKVSQKFTL